MTGFGAADGAVAGGRLRLEIRSVNHRHLSVQLKVPGQLSDAEGAIRERLRGHFERGHVTVAGRWLEEPAAADAVTVDVERARALVAALRKLGRDLQLTGKVDLPTVARLPEVVRVTRPEAPPDGDGVLALLDRAARACVAEREREGAALSADLLARLEALAALARAIAAAAPERVVRERDRRAAAVQELAGGVAVDPARLAQEVAVFADRTDVAEEITRLRSHVAQVRALLSASDPAGRKLDFLVQEMHREANTIGSKSQHAEISAVVVALKAEIERMREQVQNVE